MASKTGNITQRNIENFSCISLQSATQASRQGRKFSFSKEKFISYMKPVKKNSLHEFPKNTMTTYHHYGQIIN